MEPKIHETEGMPGDLAHPSNEQLMECLYGEAAPAARGAIEKHLGCCSACAEKVAAWRRTMGSLDEWVWPSKKPARPARLGRWSGWAAAAALTILASVAAQIGWVKAAGFKTEQRVRDNLMASLQREAAEIVQGEIARANLIRREELQTLAESVAVAVSGESRQLLAEFIHSADAKRLADYERLRDQILQIETTRSKELQTFRQDLETVAVLTENGLRRAQDEIVTLASYRRPVSNSSDR